MSESAIPVEGYRALEPTDATLVLVENGNEIIFYYQKLTSYTIHYVDMFTRESIYASKSVIEIPVGAVITE